METADGMNAEAEMRSGWAIRGGEARRRANGDAFERLRRKYRVATERDVRDKDAYDVIVVPAGIGYGYRGYDVVKNGPGLRDSELALLCDGADLLCFGFGRSGSMIKIYTD